MSDKVLVLASTGNIGRSLVAELSRAGEAVRAATRDPSKMRAGRGAEAVRFDFQDRGTFGPALKDADRVFLLVPAGEMAPYELLTPFLEEATRGGSRKVVLMTAVGVEASDEIPYRKVELSLERSGARFVLLRPNWFMDNFHTYWQAPIQKGGLIPLPAADSKTAFIDSRDIAAAAAAALRTDRFDRRSFTLTGPESLTYAQAAAILSRAAGRDIRYAPVDDPTFVKSLVEAEVPRAYAEYLAFLFSTVRQGVAEAVTGSVRDLTGRGPRTLEAYAGDHAAAWKP